MKRFCAFAMAAMLLLSGCTPGADQTPPPDTTTPIPAQTPAEPSTLPVQVALFLPDEEARYLEVEEEEIPSLDAQNLVDALIEHDALPKDVKVISFTEKVPATLDLSQAFGDAMGTTGTAGERMLFGAVVHTFLDGFGLDEITVTCEGKTIETGHAVYDAPAAFSSGDLEWDDCYYLYADDKGNLTGDDAEVVWEWDTEKRAEHKETLDAMKANFQWGYAILNTCGTQVPLTLSGQAIIRLEGKLATDVELIAFLRNSEQPPFFQVEMEDGVVTRLYSLPVGE